MLTPISKQLESGIEGAKQEVREAAAALDDAILHDPTLTHKQRMVLIHLQSAARKQNLILEQMAIHLDYLDDRIDIIKKFIT